ncbi:MAG: hypothetical protein AABY40_03890 [Nanoarchaeota archaeon]
MENKNMNQQNDYEKYISYQKQVLEFLERELVKEIERDKKEELNKPDFLMTDDELAANEELRLAHDDEMRREENEI